MEVGVVKKKPKRGRGRPPGPVSAKERAQRRAAPTKSGAFATGAAQWHRPCRREACPLKFPCDVKTARDDLGMGTAYCVVSMPQLPEIEGFAAAYRAAREGDSELLAGIEDLKLGKLTQIMMVEADLLQHEGAAIPLYQLDEDGKPTSNLLRMVPNPRAITVVELARLTGTSGDAQMVTPKSVKRQPPLDVDEVLGAIEAGRLELDRRRQLASNTEGAR